MAKYMDMNTLRWLMYNVHNVEELFQYERFQDYDREAIDIFLDSVKDFSDRELYPTFREMDEDPARYEDGKIIVHPSVKTIMKQGADLGFISGPFNYEDGGMQMPYSMESAGAFIMAAANNNAGGYPGLTAGAAGLIAAFGSQELKDKYLPNMFSGDWGGTMCLTEPQAGSSLSDITTSASPNEDGSYNIKGQKIFISGGDHEYADNFVHLVLARIEGAPAGTRGISLMVVPKHRITDGGLAPNDVITAGDFQKMGQRGYCTTHLSFGENDDCKGWLVGEPNRGLKYMFQMMNGARISVGRDGIAIATAAYYASLQYANERPQGRRLSNDGSKDLSQGQTLIINHPDVRRMLLLQKAVVEGGLSLVMEAGKYYDMKKVTKGTDEYSKYDLLSEILMPIVKTYPAEMGRVAVNNGLQVLGGYGFCSEFVLQQYARDIRIMSIYEGTTGIQSLDLLGRKVTIGNGEAMKLLSAEIMETIQAAMTYDDLKPYAKMLGEKLQQTQEIIQHLLQFAMKGNHERYLADATIFMEFFGTIVIGWQWLKMAANAKQALLTGDKEYTEEFYESKVHTMKFFFKYEMPKTNACADILMNEETLTIAKEKELIA